MNNLTVSSYHCWVTGEQPERARRFHTSTRERLKAFAIAIHLPVLLWAASGYLIARQIFALDAPNAAAVSLTCAVVIYLVERLVLAAPRRWYMSAGRIFLGLVTALLGASVVDLTVFRPEIDQTLRADAQRLAAVPFDKERADQSTMVAERKAEWKAAQAAANCEGDGTCGTRQRKLGPVWHNLARQADFQRDRYLAAEAKLAKITEDKTQALAALSLSDSPSKKAGLLDRIDALHRFTLDHPAALIGWALFFTFVVCIEMTVILVKLAFGDTVDDQIERMREQLSYHQATQFMKYATSAEAPVHAFLERPA